MTRRRRLAILILAATFCAEAAQAQEHLEPYVVAKRWSDVNLVPLALPGQTLQQAFERLSASGLWCTIHADPTLFCRASADLPSERCKSISVIVSADDREWPKAPEVADRIGDVLGRHVSSASPFCAPALPDWSAEKFEPTTAAAQDAVRDAARIRAAAAPDLRRLSWQLLAEGAACSLVLAPDGARLSCTDGSLDSHICSDAAATFVAPALQGTPPTLAAWRCDRGAHVPPPPDPNEHDKWAELGVIYVAQVCAMQDPAWRSSKPLVRFHENRVRDWASIDSSPTGRCARALHLVPTELCEQVSGLDLDDGRQAQDFIQRNHEALGRLDDALKFMRSRHGDSDDKCPLPQDGDRTPPDGKLR